MPEAPAQSESCAAPLEALALPEPPVELHYRRNHFPYPHVDRARWKLEVTGTATVELRLDEGEWRPARLLPASGRFGHATWEAEYEAPAHEHQLSVRATDGARASQPERPVWNRRGYANNSIHRVRVRPA